VTVTTIVTPILVYRKIGTLRPGIMPDSPPKNGMKSILLKLLEGRSASNTAQAPVINVGFG
jgi:hypothetical protein